MAKRFSTAAELEAFLERIHAHQAWQAYARTHPVPDGPYQFNNRAYRRDVILQDWESATQKPAVARLHDAITLCAGMTAGLLTLEQVGSIEAAIGASLATAAGIYILGNRIPAVRTAQKQQHADIALQHIIHEPSMHTFYTLGRQCSVRDTFADMPYAFQFVGQDHIRMYKDSDVRIIGSQQAEADIQIFLAGEPAYIRGALHATFHEARTQFQA